MEEVVVEQTEKEENLEAEITETDVDDMSAPTTEPGTGTSGKHTIDIKRYPLVSWTFLQLTEVFMLLSVPNTTPLVAVLPGLKENIYFIIDNIDNCARRFKH